MRKEKYLDIIFGLLMLVFAIIAIIHEQDYTIDKWDSMDIFARTMQISMAIYFFTRK